MVRSLLAQSDLLVSSTSYEWESCDWSELEEDISFTLMSALERHDLPLDVRAHQEYAFLEYGDALVRFAYRLGTTGSPYTTAHDVTGDDSPFVDIQLSMLADLPPISADQAMTPLQSEAPVPGTGDGAGYNISEVHQGNPALPISGTISSDLSHQIWDQVYSQMAEDCTTGGTLWIDPNQAGDESVARLLHDDNILNSYLLPQSKETLQYRRTRTLCLSQKEIPRVHKQKRMLNGLKRARSSRKESLHPRTQHVISETPPDEEMFYGDILSAE